MNIQNLVLDINKKPFQIITANTGEIASRFVRVSIIDKSTPVDLTGVTVSLYAKKTDGNKVFNNVTIEDKTNGIILAELTSQILAVEGLVELTLLLVKNGGKLCSKQFLLNVDSSIVDDEAIESTNEFTALVDALGRVNNIDSRFENISSQLAHKVNYITPQMFGAKGDGVTDDSEAFKQLLNISHGKVDIIIPQGHYIIKTNEKLTLRSIEGQGHTPPVIEFTHEDGGFISGENTTSEKFGGIGNIVNISIYGGHVCKNLITCGYMSEGQFKGVRFGYCTESVFKINGMLELIVFDNCICSAVPVMFDVKSSAIQYNALNGITLNNGNYWMVGKLVHTARGGNITISNSWMEKVGMLLVNTSNEGFSILADGIRFTHTVSGISNIIKTTNRGNNKFIFSNSFFYFSQSVDSFIHFDKGDSLDCSSSIIVFNGNDLGSATDKLAKIVTVNDELTKKYNISVSLFNNSVSFVSNYYNDLQLAFDSGLRVHGFDDIKKGLGLVKPSLFLKSNDSNSLIEYDADNKRIVTSDTYNINKYPFLLGRAYDAPPNNPVRGMMIYYAPLSKPLWWSGVDWRDANGSVVSTS